MELLSILGLSHFAASTPQEYLQNSTDLMNYVTSSTGIGGAYAKNGLLYAPDDAGPTRQQVGMA